MSKSAALILGATLLAVGGWGSAANAATFLQAGPNGLCGSGGCFGTSNSYHQTWSGQSGVVDIAGLRLDRSILGDKQDMTFKLSFQLSDGTKIEWGSYMIAVLGGDVVTIGGPAFVWDSSQGDLTMVLDLVVPKKGGVGGGGLLSSPAEDGPAVFAQGPAAAFRGGAVPGGPSLPQVLLAQNLPAQLAATVPEPGVWALMLLGFGAAGATLRARRRVVYG